MTRSRGVVVDSTVPMQIDFGEAAGYLDHLISPEGPVADRDDAERVRGIASWA